MRSEGLCNRIVSEVSKRLKEHFLGPFWGPSKKGSFYPSFRGGSEIGSKVEALRIYKVVDLVQLVVSAVVVCIKMLRS